MHFHIVLAGEIVDTAIPIIRVPPFPSIRQLQQSSASQHLRALNAVPNARYPTIGESKELT